MTRRCPRLRYPRDPFSLLPPLHSRAPGGGRVEDIMEDRGDRRNRTAWYARRAYAVYYSLTHPFYTFYVGRPNVTLQPVKPFSVGMFAKAKSYGCSCRRHRRGRPKVCTSCSYGPCYQPSVVERIEGRRTARAWLRDIQAGIEADDIEL